ncbi:hypothetical protein, partial [Burkholderia sola]|uniref:hypothetical protein n=1 Tax=Burkholderia sola TaxID=2843302 RepID=UPI0023DE0EE5
MGPDTPTSRRAAPLTGRPRTPYDALNVRAPRAERPAVDDRCRDEPRAVEPAEKPAAAVVAVEQDRRVVVGFAVGPAGHVVELGHEMQRAVAQYVQVFDDFSPVDGPHERHVVAGQQAGRQRVAL